MTPEWLTTTMRDVADDLDTLTDLPEYGHLSVHCTQDGSPLLFIQQRLWVSAVQRVRAVATWAQRFDSVVHIHTSRLCDISTRIPLAGWDDAEISTSVVLGSDIATLARFLPLDEAERDLTAREVLDALKSVDEQVPV